ncbi:hypothetical protein SFC23_17755 [Shouchella clausii]
MSEAGIEMSFYYPFQPFGLKLNNIQMMDYDPYGRFIGRMGKIGECMAT